MVNLQNPTRRFPRPIFTDSSAWIAWFKKDDSNHQRAQQIIESQIPADIPLLTSNLVLYEVLTVLSMRAGKNRSLEFGKWFFEKALPSETIQYVFVNEAQENKAWNLFCSIKNKDISFTDCASAIISKEWDVREILTFDQDFLEFKRIFGIEIFR